MTDGPEDWAAAMRSAAATIRQLTAENATLRQQVTLLARQRDAALELHQDAVQELWAQTPDTEQLDIGDHT